MDVQEIKQRFGIIGNSPGLSRAIEVAVQVAPTDLSVLITGESGTGKESFPQIIHQFSTRKHGKYIAINCGAIPEGTIDSELFGHEKGSFTGALADRKGYFEEANGGTIFLDEIGELPLSTQARLLRVLEAGEFMKVGSSKVLKTDVRVVAATNIDIPQAIQNGKFREDLYYRLNTVPVKVLPLRDRKEDIHLLFRKFASDFAERYRMPPVRLTDDAQDLLRTFDWPGNVRQLKNITEQISIIEQTRVIDAQTLGPYIPEYFEHHLPALYKGVDEKTFSTEREILYKILFDMKKDMNDLKKLVLDMLQSGGHPFDFHGDQAHLIQKLYPTENGSYVPDQPPTPKVQYDPVQKHDIQDTEEYVEESLSLEDKEIELIKKALEKHKGKRKYAAHELGISERTLYRKIKEYDID
ncbi:MAG: sigma-54-dependent Fis family transcriptional regulator [Bacteroidetes bacterium GWF2_42_66]|nr:MAG: sigma-54-dependent Fis family transcriptional regulator [Bacteroidetes bacterium GWA2_42_15]OFY02129.1 MAG: sigma-54-dependent Fis family transcriptional regulator [Bacteroidetes bacterium GWE2_42_39]OFY43475.1 MAG: sigma-54-dependent Fis family transcriptional regulator [Bacteroidetes bacterium GWF2_42_66]HBL76562.1 sigma-54-dependent Fis family transcriptional regulator [Prolixibacteraceae bacterium]HCR91097.1 sigma-54-dependent Fis family transcriptional regulator [Prolixibacteraceae